MFKMKIMPDMAVYLTIPAFMRLRIATKLRTVSVTLLVLCQPELPVSKIKPSVKKRMKIPEYRLTVKDTLITFNGGAQMLY